MMHYRVQTVSQCVFITVTNIHYYSRFHHVSLLFLATSLFIRPCFLKFFFFILPSSGCNWRQIGARRTLMRANRLIKECHNNRWRKRRRKKKERKKARQKVRKRQQTFASFVYGNQLGLMCRAVFIFMAHHHYRVSPRQDKLSPR